LPLHHLRLPFEPFAPRRHEIVDEELGIVFSFPMFNHRGGSGTVKIYNVPGIDSMQAGELFKIDRGRIVAVEAMGAQLPYGTKSGWGE
jgi:hypothetical protein